MEDLKYFDPVKENAIYYISINKRTYFIKNRQETLENSENNC